MATATLLVDTSFLGAVDLLTSPSMDAALSGFNPCVQGVAW
jgi:hypothetical protein